MTGPEARKALREWIRDTIDGQTSIRLPDIASQAATVFGQDSAFLLALLNDQFRQVIYDNVQLVIAQTRLPVVRLGDEIVDRDEVTRRAHNMAIARRWTTFFEHVGNRHVLLTNMTKADLLTAAQERYRRANVEQAYGTLWTSLANQMRDDQVVGDVFQPETINTLWQQISGEFAATDNPVLMTVDNDATNRPFARTA